MAGKRSNLFKTTLLYGSIALAGAASKDTVVTNIIHPLMEVYQESPDELRKNNIIQLEKIVKTLDKTGNKEGEDNPEKYFYDYDSNKKKLSAYTLNTSHPTLEAQYDMTKTIKPEYWGIISDCIKEIGTSIHKENPNKRLHKSRITVDKVIKNYDLYDGKDSSLIEQALLWYNMDNCGYQPMTISQEGQKILTTITKELREFATECEQHGYIKDNKWLEISDITPEGETKNKNQSLMKTKYEVLLKKTLITIVTYMNKDPRFVALQGDDAEIPYLNKYMYENNIYDLRTGEKLTFAIENNQRYDRIKQNITRHLKLRGDANSERILVAGKDTIYTSE